MWGKGKKINLSFTGTKIGKKHVTCPIFIKLVTENDKYGTSIEDRQDHVCIYGAAVHVCLCIRFSQKGFAAVAMVMAFWGAITSQLTKQMSFVCTQYCGRKRKLLLK